MTDPDESEPAPRVGAEKAALHAHLKRARDSLIWKVEGLTEADRRRPMTPTGTNLIGMVKHMTWIESWYLCEFFSRERPRLAWEWEVDADWGPRPHVRQAGGDNGRAGSPRTVPRPQRPIGPSRTSSSTRLVSTGPAALSRCGRCS